MADSVRNYQQLAQDVIRLVGGKENIVSAERCATRLRLVLNEKPAGAEEEVKKTARRHYRGGKRRTVSDRNRPPCRGCVCRGVAAIKFG